MIRFGKLTGAASLAACTTATWGQGAILHDTATVEIVDMPTAISMGAPIHLGMPVFNYNFETGKLTFRPGSSSYALAGRRSLNPHRRLRSGTLAPPSYETQLDSSNHLIGLPDFRFDVR